jgi:shikimate kinase
MIDKNKKNIISLIGMTGVGKTTVGKTLAKKINFTFFDLDAIIAEKTGKSPTEIFSLHGEETFRQIETEELETIFKNHNKNFILSCGGGIILKEKNKLLLKENSFVVWLLRPVSEIVKNENILKRPPVNNDINNYIKLFEQRKQLYAETCDLKIDYIYVSDAVKRIMVSLN